MEYPDPASGVATDLKPCPICGRTFRPDALTRHHRVCEKNATKKRKVFDSSKQRAPEDAAAPPPTKAAPPPSKRLPTKAAAVAGRKAAAAASKKTQSNWREKHEELIDTIKRARGEGGGAPSAKEPVQKKVPSDYVQCGSCGRHFNQRAAERHIPWCQKKAAETPPAPRDPAKEKLIARVRYRPPQGRSRRPARRHTQTADSAVDAEADRRRPAAVPVVPKPVVVVRSSPPNLVDKRNARNASLDRRNNNSGARNDNWRWRSGSREKEPPTSSQSSPDLTAHIIKFKERFPNSHKKRNFDLEESLTSEQLRELLSCSRITDRCPRTVPGVRLSRNDNWNYNHSEVIRSSSSSSGSSNGWNKRSVVRSTLPEVSSSEWVTGSKPCWGGGELSDSACSTGGSSSGSSLPPLSREASTGADQRCHLCRSPFPMAAAKYCCECGARRKIHTG